MEVRGVGEEEERSEMTKTEQRPTQEERALKSRAKSSIEITKRNSVAKLSSAHSSFSNFSELMEPPL